MSTPPTQNLRNPDPTVTPGAGDHCDKAGTGAYSYSQPEYIPALVKYIRETLMTVKGAAPHGDKLGHCQLEALDCLDLKSCRTGVLSTDSWLAPLVATLWLELCYLF
jgi:hypothetical protein